ncbi:nuclear transport factor 2 family protein [Rhodococcus sp. NPDC057014]|uniref:nuclear transport factor 2 family protein n=1 Tax=Rhodococcus sp. NPDC057014 TaxID=3346000 RepID=UPI0036380625
MTTSPRQTVEAFIAGFRLQDVDAALSTVSGDVQVTVYPLQLSDSGKPVISKVLDDIVVSFPDLHLTVRNVLELGRVVVVEMKIEGTQAADYLGAINQEKHLDVDSAWRFTVTGDAITGIDVYWCQNQLYRRLAVKRTDQVTIV